MLGTLTALVEWIGIIAFALTGALVASRKQMDIVGFALLATVTGIGGGVVRDLLLGIQPVSFVRDPEAAGLCLLIGALTFFFAHLPASRLSWILWADALGLAAFAVGGAATALEQQASPVIAMVMGMISATFGGILRDVLAGETPVVLSREIYVTAALLGACLHVLLLSLGLSREAAMLCGFVGAFGLRGVALWRGWSLPRYRPRPPRNHL